MSRHQESRPFFASVGSKLAGSTIALIAVVTVGVYLQLSRYQRESQFASKETAASAVTRLFADSCAAAVIFEDATAIEEALATLGRNEEIEYAAVWATDPTGRATRRLGELSRGRAELVGAAPAALHLRRDPDRVVLTSPIWDQSAQPVAAAVIAFSLLRENRAIASLERTTLIVSICVALGLLAVLLGMARIAIVGPLGKLVAAARELEAGGPGKLDVRTNDEVGQLAHAFRSMADAITVRQARINARNRDMRLLLDNVGQGFVTLNMDGVMSEERSRVIDEWFGAIRGQPKMWEFLDAIDAPAAQWFELGWTAIQDDLLPLSLCLEQLPALVRKDGRTFELGYRPVMEGERLDSTIVVITDATARIEHERAEQAQREMMNIFRRMLSDRFALDQFFVENGALVDEIAGASDEADLEQLMRAIHTLKGNCALFGIESVAGFCHDLEDRMSESAESLSPGRRLALRGLWSNVQEMRVQLTRGSESGVELEGEEYAAFMTDLVGRVAHDLLLATAASWQFEPASKRLQLLAEQIRGLGKRMHRATIEVTCQPTNLRLPPRKWGPFWSVFSHMVRNAVDHGIETTEERIAAGKPGTAGVTLGIGLEGQRLVVSIGDDGRGVDWSRIEARARGRGLPCATPAELEEALFVDGISSREEVTATSGRGVGLGAVRETVRRLGGDIEIHTEPGRGTTFRFVLPQSLLFDDEPSGDGAERGQRDALAAAPAEESRHASTFRTPHLGGAGYG